LRKKDKRLSIKETAKKFYYTRSFRIIAGVLVVTVFVTMVLQSATLVAISRSDSKSDAAVNYLAENTEYVNKNRPQRVLDYLQTRDHRKHWRIITSWPAPRLPGKNMLKPLQISKNALRFTIMKVVNFIWICF
jgi:hypothetical protein